MNFSKSTQARCVLWRKAFTNFQSRYVTDANRNKKQQQEQHENKLLGFQARQQQQQQIVVVGNARGSVEYNGGNLKKGKKERKKS